MTKPIQKKRTAIKNPIKKYNDSLAEDQAAAKKVIDRNVITCLLGRAGSGKTFLATVYALEQYALGRKHGGIDRIIISRPTVSRKEDNLGYAPGTPTEKLNFWVQPILDILHQVEGVEATDKLLKDRTVQIQPLMHIMGLSFHNAIVILDEAQNLDKFGMEMVFSRIGKNSKLILCGDDKQSLIDVRETGLSRLVHISDQIENLDYFKLSSNFRNEIVERLLEVY